MNEDKMQLHAYYTKVFQEETKNRSEQYVITARKTITLPLLVNAAASTALVNFFTREQGLPSLINIAAVLFIVGAVFGILTLVFEFFAAYFSYFNFISTVKKIGDSAGNPEVQLDEFIKHYKSLGNVMDGAAKVVLFEVICGAIGIFCGMLGIYCVMMYLTGSCIITSIGLFVIVVGSILSICWIKRSWVSVKVE